MSIGLRLIAIACAVAASFGWSAPAIAQPSDPTDTRPAQLLPAGLQGTHGPQRVEIHLLQQPVLAAAARPRLQALLSPPARPVDSVVARLNPLVVTEAERAAAAELEVRYDRAVLSLGDESRTARKGQRSLLAAIRRSGGTAIARSVLPNAIVARVRSRSLGTLASRGDVESIAPAPRAERHLNVSAEAVGAPAWWDAGFTGGEGPGDVTGSTVDVAAVNDAVDPSHPAFAAVDVINSPREPSSDHGTHVGGVIASNDPSQRGVAYGVDTLIGADDLAYAIGVPNGNDAGSPAPAEIINYSAGSPATTDEAGRGEDLVVDLFGVGYAASAGNDGSSRPVSNIGRNMLSVAASNDNNTVSPDDDAILASSSRGPSPGGRKKPDLIAPGASIMAPSAFWNSPAENPDYTPLSGTSFAAPHVAGGLALLAGAGIADPRTQRAILINSARDWAGQTHWQPDVGWGALDLEQALADRGNIAESSVEGGGARFFAATSEPGAKATLAWNLRGVWPNFPETAPAPITYTTTNLDLRSYRRADLSEVTPAADPGHGGGPDAVDANDTTEQVRAPALEPPQDLVYKVEAVSQIEGATEEEFSLAAESELEPLVAPEVEPSASTTDASEAVSCSTDVIVSTTVRNESPDLPAGSSAPTSAAARVSIDLPSGVQLISGDATQVVSGGSLEPATSEQHSWTVRASSDGLKQLTITGTGTTLGETFTTEKSVPFTADCTAPDTAISMGPNGPTRDSTPSFSFSAPGAAGYECRIDTAAFAGCSSPFQAPELADGSHSFEVRAIDGAGNVEATPARRTVVVDTRSPESTITGGPAGTTPDPRPAFSFRADEGGAKTLCRLDSGAFSPCSSPFGFARLADGPHVFAVRAVDAAGNAEPQPASRAFTVDTRVSGAAIGARSTQPQRGRRAKVKVEVTAAEDLLVTVEGKIRIPGKDARLADRSARVSPATPTKLVLKPRTRRDSRRVLRAVRAGKPAGAELEATFIDAVGNELRPSLGVRLR